ncbi:MAG: chemotaxis protein CheB [Hyphomicrobiaceae bacterium]
MPASRPPRAVTNRSLTKTTRAAARNSQGDAAALPLDFTVVGVGASAGGLDACRQLLAALPAGHGMAFILILHLDPTHDSLMADLLANHTTMTVRQVTDGMPIERDHFYVIPPGTYLSAVDGVLHLSAPGPRHGARLPFDFLLHSLADQCGRRAICVILSGTGADGSLGVHSIKDKGGFVIAQNPDEAGFDGMPLSAIASGAVDLVLPAGKIPEALIGHNRSLALTGDHESSTPPPASPDWLPRIVELLRANTAHDFRLYKQGTLRRRIERRMGLRGMAITDGGRYLEVLNGDAGELDLLAKDLLINVTSFFRDPTVFTLLAKTIVPDLVRNQSSDQPLRIWVSGCSTGEEAYSLAMLFREEIAASKRNLKLQVFASDVDPDAIANAREGTYPDAIEADVLPERLAGFFTKEATGYRVSPELRATVTFTVQDVLADPPFSRLDIVSCRNLLIYLGPEAQSKVIALFHFALREGGILLLGSSETIGNIDGRFEAVSKSERVYRRITRSRSVGLVFAPGPGDGLRLPVRQGQGHAPSRQAVLTELCRRYVLEAYAPAVVLINHRHECLYSLGPIERYLRVAPGHPTHDLMAMAPDDLRFKLRAAIERAEQGNSRTVVAGGQIHRDGKEISFNIDIRPLVSDGEALLLVCFADEHVLADRAIIPTAAGDVTRVAELELELAATRTELQGAIRNLAYSDEEQRAINEEALSINEEFQSTNEELLTSKEELQSLNEELTALNGQLQETLERQRATANDLQNVLYSTDVATIFLDVDLNIRFFTPATKVQFSVIPSDIGRPLDDLKSLSADRDLTTDARAVLADRVPIDREIETERGVWFMRRILPYRTDDGGVDGVVITFTDLTERKRVKSALETAKQDAERATIAKSRFLAAASHDLRQPLQTFSLLQGLLARLVVGDKAKALVARLDDTLGAMTGMLDALLDINRIEAGTVRAETMGFSIDSLLSRMRDEFTLHAKAKKLGLRIVPCHALVYGDPRLLEQMLRNLLSNAVKYTEHGKILVGCRQRGRRLHIEIWDTGIGIPESELQAIFEEYHQLDNAARERARGLGLGLSIVRRLGKLFGAEVSARSRLGKSSVFTIDVKLADVANTSITDVSGQVGSTGQGPEGRQILVVEDDPDVRDLLVQFLEGEGYRAAAAAHGLAALELIQQQALQPDLILADYNLPSNMTGLQLAERLREQCHRQLPVIILTGDISTDTLKEIARQGCVHLNKPVKLKEMTQTIERLLSPTQAASTSVIASDFPARHEGTSVIFVVDDDDQLRQSVRAVLEDDGRTVEDFTTCEAFLAAYRPGGDSCLLIDAYLPGMSGLELLQRLRADGRMLPAIMITGNSDVPMAVQAMKAGAFDFVEKPVGREALLACIERALEQSRDGSKLSSWRASAAEHVAKLTSRERQIMALVLAGHPSKNIAADLGISQRTVENHRASIMKKTGVKSLPELARLALAAESI